MNIQQVWNNFLAGVKQHSPEILTGIGIAGMTTSTVLAVRATPRALKLIEKEEQKKGDGLKPLEVLKATWKCYIPSVATGAVSIVCLIVPHNIHAQRYAALATVHSVTEDAFRTYQAKVIETIGENKEKSIRQEIDKEDMLRHPHQNAKVHVQKKGEVLCYEVRSKSYFMSDAETIRQCKNEFKGRLVNELYCSYTDWLYDLGCPPEYPFDSDSVGWNSDDVKNFDILIGVKMAADGETPCLTVSFPAASMPHVNYKNWR